MLSLRIMTSVDKEDSLSSLSLSFLVVKELFRPDLRALRLCTPISEEEYGWVFIFIFVWGLELLIYYGTEVYPRYPHVYPTLPSSVFLLSLPFPSALDLTLILIIRFETKNFKK